MGYFGGMRKIYRGSLQATNQMTPENLAVFELLTEVELMVVDMRVRLKLLKKIRKHPDQQGGKTVEELWDLTICNLLLIADNNLCIN